ncbi:MAG: prolyl oligopeptidase family serine peptidase [Anaerolineae bacterium]|nr:prolyl oligopeptidase family serine peptidase [Anaerolineae bacterium]
MRAFSSHVDGYYDVSDQMIDDLRRRAEAHFRRQEREREAIATVEQFEEHRRQVRRRFLEAVGGLPEERTPLEARCTGILDRGDYTIEKIIYQSLPQFYVTANLYVPKALDGKVPGILFVCGHSESGKAEPRYQAVCSDLAQNGFVVLAMDPPGQGERFQYFDPETGRRNVGGCTVEHSYAGLQYILDGASIARHFIWDGMRGVDYLQSRPEVDRERIGVTGNSGGGTQTCLLMMSDDRFAAGAPCCFVMTLESYMKTGQAQDAEQLVRGAMAWGPDYYQYLTAMAPKPVMVGAALYDFFPIEGARESVRRAHQVYRLYGAEDKVGIAYSPATHGFTAPLREAVVNWMRVHLKGEPGDFCTGEPEVLPEAELHCTTAGQVLAEFPRSKTVFDLNRERLWPPTPPTDAAELRRQLAEVLGIADEPLDHPIDPRVVFDDPVEGYRTEHVFFFSAPDIVVTGVMIHPRQAGPVVQIDLVLLEQGSDDIPAQRARLEALLRRGHRLFVFDPRGRGAIRNRPVNSRDPGADYGTEYKLASDAMLLGVSTLGLRVFDVLRGLAYLRTREDCAGSRLGLYGLGFGGTLAYLAAALDGELDSVTVEDTLYSYRDLATTRYYSAQHYGVWSVAWGFLRHFDLADLLPCMGEAEVTLVNPRDARGEVAAPETVRQQYFDRGFGPVRVLLPASLEPEAAG